MSIISQIMGSVSALITGIVVSLKNTATAAIKSLWLKYLDISLSEKIIFLNTIAAFFAIVLPVAKFYIFEAYFYVNNPLGVYMIGIVVIMFASLYFTGLIKFIIRLFVNWYYLFWIIYIPLAGDLTKADPYEICAGYYLNLAVPAVYITASLFSYLLNYE